MMNRLICHTLGCSWLLSLSLFFDVMIPRFLDSVVSSCTSHGRPSWALLLYQNVLMICMKLYPNNVMALCCHLHPAFLQHVICNALSLAASLTSYLYSLHYVFSPSNVHKLDCHGSYHLFMFVLARSSFFVTYSNVLGHYVT